MKEKLSKILAGNIDQAFLLVKLDDGSVIGVLGDNIMDVDQTPVERIINMVEEEYSLSEVIFDEVEEPDGITFKVLDEDGDTVAHLGLTHTWIY